LDSSLFKQEISIKIFSFLFKHCTFIFGEKTAGSQVLEYDFFFFFCDCD
jgi:hypothetical protein